MACAPGSSDHDNNPLSPCQQCPAGAHVQAQQTGPCSRFLCVVGQVDADSNASTPCTECTGESFQDQPGQTTCKPAAVCGAGFEAVPNTLSAATNRVCRECTVGETFKPEAGNNATCQTLLPCPAGQYDTQVAGQLGAGTKRRSERTNKKKKREEEEEEEEEKKKKKKKRKKKKKKKRKMMVIMTMKLQSAFSECMYL